MKRIFTLLLCAAVLLSFSACSKAKEPAPTPTKLPTAAPTTEPPATESAFVPIVPVDNDKAAFLITGVEDTPHAGMQLQVQCVNKTDHAMMFSWDLVSVCGYMYDPMWSVEVAGNKAANSAVDLDTFALEKMGIESVDEVTFTLRIYDSEDWMAEPYVEEPFTVYPTGLDADTAVSPERPEIAGQQVVAEDENLRFVIEGIDHAAPSYESVLVYMENNTDRNLMFSWDLVSVNGKMLDPYWATAVSAGKKACSEVTFSRTDLEKNGIKDISEIEFTLTVSDYDDWSAEDLLKTEYTYTP